MRYQKNDKIIAIFETKHFLLNIKNINPFEYEIIKILNINNENDFKLHLILPLCNPKINALMFQKATELGVNLIIPFCFKQSLSKLDQKSYLKKLTRYKLIVKEAGEQSNRNLKVKILNHLINWNEIKNYLLTNNFVCSLNGNKLQKNDFKKTKDTLIVIGPPKGFLIEELEFFKSLNFKFIKLSNLVLRTETALINALSICNYLLNETFK